MSARLCADIFVALQVLSGWRNLHPKEVMSRIIWCFSACMFNMMKLGLVFAHTTRCKLICIDANSGTSCWSWCILNRPTGLETSICITWRSHLLSKCLQKETNHLSETNQHSGNISCWWGHRDAKQEEGRIPRLTSLLCDAKSFFLSYVLQPANQSASVQSSAWRSTPLSWSSKPAQHACPAPLHLQQFCSVNKIHFHRFVCSVFVYL